VTEPLPERFTHATASATSLFYSRVAGLKRSVFFTAEEKEVEGEIVGETDKFLIGGHLIIFLTPGVAQKLEGVKITNFGQQGNLGRYVSLIVFISFYFTVFSKNCILTLHLLHPMF